MRRISIVFSILAVATMLLAAGPALANTGAVLGYNWGGSAGIYHRGAKATLNFRWSGGAGDIRTKVRIVNRKGHVLSRTSATVPEDQSQKLTFRARWRKGRYTIRMYGVDEDGVHSWFYPYRVRFVIY